MLCVPSKSSINTFSPRISDMTKLSHTARFNSRLHLTVYCTHAMWWCPSSILSNCKWFQSEAEGVLYTLTLCCLELCYVPLKIIQRRMHQQHTNKKAELKKSWGRKRERAKKVDRKTTFPSLWKCFYWINVYVVFAHENHGKCGDCYTVRAFNFKNKIFSSLWFFVFIWSNGVVSMSAQNAHCISVTGIHRRIKLQAKDKMPADFVFCAHRTAREKKSFCFVALPFTQPQSSSSLPHIHLSNRSTQQILINVVWSESVRMIWKSTFQHMFWYLLCQWVSYQRRHRTRMT